MARNSCVKIELIWFLVSLGFFKENKMIEIEIFLLGADMSKLIVK